MEHKSGCLVCGKEIVYLPESENKKCFYCNDEFDANEYCTDGHFVCNSCHSLTAIDLIESFCANTEITDPIDAANTLMSHPSVKMHGPEHHFLVPAVLIAAYYKTINEAEKIPAALKKARKRAESVLGGFCGTHGNCGAGVGTGIFISVITGANSLSGKEWQLCNLMTACSLYSIAKSGGPRCCKRDSYLAILEAVGFIEKEFNVKITTTSKITCNYVHLNKECTLEKCEFYNPAKNLLS